MAKEPLDHYILVVRAWKRKSSSSDDEPWRFTLLESTSEERRGFATPQALCDALYVMLSDLTADAPD